ncbi:adenylyltransferase/cytidyltransferase family protein [Candidatus Roizmanbacteria bacterium]|nr:adenylyltransferase/cytidyltransferase family protein [Candidatus Roizmanbacteria bacterium]
MSPHDKIMQFDSNVPLKGVFPGTVVMAGGCFDIFHYGHLQFLIEARRAGDSLVIALEPDDFITQRKGRVPFHTQMQRASILARLDIVDAVILLPFFTTDKEYDKMVTIIAPDVIAVTEGDAKIEQKRKQAERVGGEVKVVCGLLDGLSSSTIGKYETVSRNRNDGGSKG